MTSQPSRKALSALSHVRISWRLTATLVAVGVLGVVPVAVADPASRFGARGAAAPTSTSLRGTSVIQLPRPRPARVWFKSRKVRLGLTTEERARLTRLCAQEPVPDACLQQLAQLTGLPRLVEVSAFGLDRTETTLRAYGQCLRAGACPSVPDARLDSPGAANLPLVYVDRVAAQAYCQFRGGRLPRQREFERAARSDANWLFPWGDLYNSMLSNHGRFALDRTDGSDGSSERAPVGSYATGATTQGVLDLSGNVAEWVDPDPPEEEALSAVTNSPPGLVCGGDFATGAAGLAATSCLVVDPRHRDATVGFRCAYDDETRLIRTRHDSEG